MPVPIDPSASQPWREIATKRKQEINDAIPDAYRIFDKALLQTHNVTSIPAKSGILTPRELQITEARAVDLVEAIRTRIYTSFEVTTAFCKRAAIAHQVTNCIAAVLFDSALERARELDKYMEDNNKPVGPLHGLPISVKEHIYLTGTYATSGMITWANDMSPCDALIIAAFREAGAVFHVKTTNPQTLMALETDSNLFGRTVNPFNTALTSGGSSGGEAALVGMRGSPLGIGTDIGGSIRVPSAFCGGYGLKGSVARLPHSGLSGIHGGMENIIGCVGPMANSIADLRLFCQVALECKPWEIEPSLICKPWQTEDSSQNLASGKKLKIAVLYHDSIVLPHPPITRALNSTVEALLSAGHELIEWSPQTLHGELIDWINKAYFLDGGAEYFETLDAGSESAVPIIQWLLDKFTTKVKCTVDETWKINSLHERLRTKYLAQWRSLGVDAILAPCNASVASAHEESHYWGYSSVFNALDLAAAVFPVDFVDGSAVPDAVEETYISAATMSDTDTEYRGFWLAGGVTKYKDAPVNLQLVGKRLEEENLLNMLEVVDEAVKRRKNIGRN